MNPAVILRLALLATTLIDEILGLMNRIDSEEDIELSLLGTDLAQARARLQAAIAKRQAEGGA